MGQGALMTLKIGDGPLTMVIGPKMAFNFDHSGNTEYMSRQMKKSTKWHVHQAQISLGICPV